MTNEEKAKALFYHFCTERTCGGYDSCENCPKSKSHEALLEMAQWKDEQFSKFLLWLDDFYVIKRFTDGEPMTYAELIDNFKSNSYERNITKTNCERGT